MVEEHAQRRLTQILAAGMVGYSAALRVDEADTLDYFRKLRRELLEPKAVEYGGLVVKTSGDEFLIELGR